jgi:hypothetical protein
LCWPMKDFAYARTSGIIHLQMPNDGPHEEETLDEVGPTKQDNLVRKHVTLAVVENEKYRSIDVSAHALSTQFARFVPQ